MKRNRHIDYLRLYFSIAIVLFHEHGLISGYIAVEFFAILSGFLAMKSNSNNEDDIIDIFINKYLYFLPYIFISAGFPVVLNMIFRKVSIIDSLCYFGKLITCINGLMPSKGDPTWYISAYLICYPLYKYLISKESKFFKNIGILIFPLFFLMYLYFSGYTNVQVWSGSGPFGFLTLGVWRVFAGMCFGGVVFFLSEKIRYFSVVFSSVIEFLSICILGFLMLLTNSIGNNILEIMLIAVLIVSSSKNESIWAKILNKTFTNFPSLLSGVSVSVFVSHYQILEWLDNINWISYITSNWMIQTILIFLWGGCVYLFVTLVNKKFYIKKILFEYK